MASELVTLRRNLKWAQDQLDHLNASIRLFEPSFDPKTLPKRFPEMGIEDTARNLSNKIARGGFTAGLLIQCLEAIGCHVVRLDES